MNKLKLSILLIVFQYVLIPRLYGQSESGNVFYNVIKSEDRVLSNDLAYSTFMKNVDRALGNLEFQLTFDRTKSSFSLVKNLALENANFDTRTAIIVLGADESFFADLENKVLLEEKDFLGKRFIVTTPFKELGWELTKETKIIEGYTCLKAIGTREATSRDFSKRIVYVHAWYTLEIPFNFGPFEAVGLPGLVLEFSSPSFSYVASKIEFTKDVVVKKPKTGEVISKDEFDKVVSKKAKTTGY